MTNKKIDRYEIVSEVGQGAMGVVYRANDPLLERTVAIKTINLDLSKDEFEEFEKRFYREASSAGRLNHPNIVTIHDVGNTDNIAYMAMEYLEGVELRDILDADEPLPLDRIIDISAQVADGLAFAHEHGVVHRDIKPSNIMILKNGVAKITDFGIALIPSGSRTMDGMVLGSPKYMSPEQVVGQDVDGRSDIFSLGVMLYEMLTGKSPFSGDNISTIMYRILNEMPTAPRTLKPELPESLDYIVAMALAKHPEERYESAAAMAEDLRNYQTLEIPPYFYEHSADKPRTLERRAKPRQPIEDRTVVMAMRRQASPQRASDTPPASRARWKYPLMLAIAMALIAFAFVALVPSKAPPTKVEAQIVPPVQPSRNVETASPTLAPPEPTPEANVGLAVTPWGEVFVDGQSVGVSPPMNDLQLPAGSHTIEIRNGDFPPYKATVDLKPGDSHKIRHKFN